MKKATIPTRVIAMCADLETRRAERRSVQRPCSASRPNAPAEILELVEKAFGYLQRTVNGKTLHLYVVEYRYMGSQSRTVIEAQTCAEAETRFRRDNPDMEVVECY